METVKEDKGSAEQEQEQLRQLSLIYGGLIAIGVYMVQPFLTAASLDLSARICVVAFSVAIPLLAALVVVNRQEVFRRRMTKSVVVETTRVVAQSCAFVGVVAGFWHILWIAGVGMLAAGLVAVAVHSAGYWRLERDQEPTPQEGEEPPER
jgi:fatty acid desaturase